MSENLLIYYSIPARCQHTSNCYYLLLPGLLHNVHLFLGGVQARVVPEEVRHEGQVQGLLPLHHILTNSC
jgi:hypothetical protein